MMSMGGSSKYLGISDLLPWGPVQVKGHNTLLGFFSSILVYYTALCEKETIISNFIAYLGLPVFYS